MLASLLVMARDQQLVLVSASKSRRGGHWSDDDFDVRLGDAHGQVIGHIFLSPVAPANRPWFWTITTRMPQLPTQRGYATTREDAMVALRLAWDAKRARRGCSHGMGQAQHSGRISPKPFRWKNGSSDLIRRLIYSLFIAPQGILWHDGGPGTEFAGTL
jgi:hypothetical protein